MSQLHSFILYSQYVVSIYYMPEGMSYELQTLNLKKFSFISVKPPINLKITF